MIKVGVTGGIGAGKSVVSAILMAMGYPVFNSDDEAKEIVNNDLGVRSQLIDLLGESIYTENGIDRQQLASHVFQNHVVREKVNAIIHPAVRNAFEEYCARLKSDIVFNEAAILFETGSFKRFDKNILVVAPMDIRIKRVIKRDNVDAESVKHRIASQWDDSEKMNLADYILVNDERQPLLSQVEGIIDQLISS